MWIRNQMKCFTPVLGQSYQPSTLQPRLAFAGRQGIIRVIRPTDFNQERTFK
eukprot:gene18563-8127_t